MIKNVAYIVRNMDEVIEVCEKVGWTQWKSGIPIRENNPWTFASFPKEKLNKIIIGMHRGLNGGIMYSKVDTIKKHYGGMENYMRQNEIDKVIDYAKIKLIDTILEE